VAPPKSCGLKPKRKRASPIKVRLSEAERETVRAKAIKAHLSVNAFIRTLLLGADYDPTVKEQLRKANLELTRQGNNLNQIAKRLNGGRTSEAEADSLLGMLARSMLQTHRAIRAALAQGPEP
jgi:hypothetical protein